MTITEFLLARIAEDEAHILEHSDAGEVIALDGYRHTPWALGLSLDSSYSDYDIMIDPARILAECEAKRRIVSRCDLVLRGRDEDMFSEGQAGDARDNLRALAAIYADHPDYDEAWRP